MTSLRCINCNGLKFKPNSMWTLKYLFQRIHLSVGYYLNYFQGAHNTGLHCYPNINAMYDTTQRNVEYISIRAAHIIFDKEKLYDCLLLGQWYENGIPLKPKRI